MSKPGNKKIIEIAWNKAHEYMAKDGWATREVDEAIVDRLYRLWIRETDATWQSSGYRNRAPLWKALEETFTQHYGEDAATARLIIFTVFLEIRARVEGFTNPGRTED